MEEQELTHDQELADSVMSGLVGSAMCACPGCGTKTLSWKVYRDDPEHKDEVYRCGQCKHAWTRYMPTGRIADQKEVGLVPFDESGNHTSHGWSSRSRENFVFTDTLRFERIAIGRYSYAFIFVRKAINRSVYVMRADFETWIPLMHGGEIADTFTFRKRGTSAGVCLYREKPPKKPRAKRKVSMTTRLVSTVVAFIMAVIATPALAQNSLPAPRPPSEVVVIPTVTPTPIDVDKAFNAIATVTLAEAMAMLNQTAGERVATPVATVAKKEAKK